MKAEIASFNHNFWSEKILIDLLSESFTQAEKDFVKDYFDIKMF